jgi:hypothetical protein
VRSWPCPGPALLDTYEIERRPLAMRNTGYARGFADSLGLFAPESPRSKTTRRRREQARRAAGAYLDRHARAEFNIPGITFGGRCDGSPAIVQRKNTICLWYDGARRSRAGSTPAPSPTAPWRAVHRAPADYPSGKQGDVLTVEFTVMGIPCLGLNGGPAFRHSEAFSFQVATTTRPRPTATGTPSSATAARKAPAAGARTAGACRGRSRRAR